MRIEVLIGSEDPVIHPLKMPKMLIGSSESCDVVVSSDGISRKHLLIQSDGDQFFVTDQGSTNGSFINEERLVPGKRVEFTSFFPVRLGENVLISLLSDDEGFDAPSEPMAAKNELSSPSLTNTKRPGATSTIRFEATNPSPAIKQKLDKVEAKRAEAGVKGPPPRRKVEKKNNKLPMMAVLIVVAAAYYNFFVAPPENTDDQQIAEVGQIIKPEPVAEKPAEPEVNLDLVPETELPKKESFANLINDLKCTNDVERTLCDMIPGAREEKFGVVQVGLTYNILINADHFIGEAKDKLFDPNWNDPADVRRYMDDLYTIAAYIFIKNKMPPLDEALLGPDAKVAIGLYKWSENSFQVERVIVFYPKILNREKGNFDDAKLFYVKKAGIQSLDPFQKTFRVY